MFFKTTTILALAAAPFAYAQNNNAIQLQSIIAQFKNAGLTPSPITTFEPCSLLSVSYGNSAIDAGKPQTVATVKPQPTIQLTPSVINCPDLSTESTFTIAMIDADVVGASQSGGQTRHWLVNGVKPTGTESPWTLDVNSGTNITAYGGPFPAEGSGAHRYMILALLEPTSFTAPSTPAPGSPIEKFDFEGYVKSAGLSYIIAGTYITVEQGTATASVSPTSAVDTATLAASSASGSSSGTRTGSATSTATSPAGSNNAAAGRAVEWGMLGAAALLGAIAL
ncbi:phosphatidylethanolamine-binding protein (PEBP) family [Ceratobasidium sp. AG-Ba]|nr:phosphatidylethanolamine-binding protein (PEBP) family [Ceratobasidium sp. AG-Ba]QRW14430.1 phosphatidylethanolamine-binding protein (PEBP) family [Ceratobasidium sp. AG-Ba]